MKIDIVALQLGLLVDTIVLVLVHLQLPIFGLH